MDNPAIPLDCPASGHFGFGQLVRGTLELRILDFELSSPGIRLVSQLRILDSVVKLTPLWIFLGTTLDSPGESRAQRVPTGFLDLGELDLSD